MNPAPIAPAGVTANAAPLTAEQRDSIVTMKMKAVAAMVAAGLAREPTEAEKRQLAPQVEPGAPLPGTRAAGAAPLMNGHALAGGRVTLGSISAPLLSRKPLPAEPLEARLLRARLEDRAKLKRDSLRADSIASQVRP